MSYDLNLEKPYQSWGFGNNCFGGWGGEKKWYWKVTGEKREGGQKRGGGQLKRRAVRTTEWVGFKHVHGTTKVGRELGGDKRKEDTTGEGQTKRVEKQTVGNEQTNKAQQTPRGGKERKKRGPGAKKIPGGEQGVSSTDGREKNGFPRKKKKD